MTMRDHGIDGRLPLDEFGIQPRPAARRFARRRTVYRASLPGTASWPALKLANLYLAFANTLGRALGRTAVE
jgi:hypothetical protein